MPLTIGDCEFTENQAHEAIAGYAFGTVSLHWASRRPQGGGPPRPTSRPRWAYRTFDCVPADGDGLTARDITITAALNSRIGGKATLGAWAVAADVSEALGAVADSVAFWDLERDDLLKRPAGDGPAASLWRAWELLMGVPGIDLAVSHKILHHKRPGLCPLLDRVTEGAYPPGQAWAGIHKELTDQTDEFTQLEGWFEGLAASHDGVALQRLRLHDILLWLCRSGELDEARRLGRNVL